MFWQSSTNSIACSAHGAQDTELCTQRLGALNRRSNSGEDSRSDSNCSDQLVRVLSTYIVDAQDPDPIASIEQRVGSVAACSGHENSGSSGWTVLLGYELGRSIESRAQYDQHAGRDESHSFPLAVIQRWELVSKDDHKQQSDSDAFEIGSLTSSMGRTGYIAAVEAVQEYIRAGDIYQANIAHHLIGSFSGSPNACFDSLVQDAEPRLGSMMVFDYHGVRHAVLSVSPELFFEYDSSSRLIVTEPMKGTRPSGSDPIELRDSIKDRAELDMITDLMRNDLGRVCELGSVRVVDPRVIESHKSGVLQASSKIQGRLRAGMGLGEILRATFPPGSITGAPKVRAMQIIDELERRPRDSYCGSMLSITDDGSIRGSVLIRTAHIRGKACAGSSDCIDQGEFVYPVGAGIVADSDPQAEWEETLVKAAVLRNALGADLGG